MANEIQTVQRPNMDLYVVAVSKTTARWLRVDTLVQENVNPANWDNYDILVPEYPTPNSTGFYRANFPAAPADDYHLVLYERLTTPPTPSDRVRGLPYLLQWGGTALVNPLTAQEVWTYGGARTLTDPAVGSSDVTTQSLIARTRGNSWSITLTDIGPLDGRTKLWFTMKRSVFESDAQAMLQVIEGEGLTRLRGAAPAAGEAAWASITVTNEVTGVVVIDVDERASALIDLKEDYRFDVQVNRAARTLTPALGLFSVTGDVTRAVE